MAEPIEELELIMIEIDFVRKIAEDPSDAVLRLVYADFLEEQGDDYHQLIRKQVAIRESKNANEVIDLIREVRMLLEQNGSKWMARFVKPPVLYHTSLTYGFGLPRKMRLWSTSGLEGLSDLALAVPGLEVAIVSWRAGWQKLVKYKGLGQIKTLTLLPPGGMTVKMAAMLARRGGDGWPQLINCDLSREAALHLRACSITIGEGHREPWGQLGGGPRSAWMHWTEAVDGLE